MPKRIFEKLDKIEAVYKNYEHNATFSCDDAKWVDIPWKRVKSLLIRNKKKTNFYMVVLWDDKKLDTNKIRAFFDDTKMSFSSEEDMFEKIWVKIWHVSPFALINNLDKDIIVAFDSELKWIDIGFHPLRNDNTTVLNMDFVEKFLNNEDVRFEYIDL